MGDEKRADKGNQTAPPPHVSPLDSPGPRSRRPPEDPPTHVFQASDPFAMARDRQSRSQAPKVTRRGKRLEHLALPLGTVLADKYRIDRLLGEGGVGEVYLAQHMILKIPVAVKVLRWISEVDQRNRRRFAREARAIALINHPNVVRLLDVGTVEGRDYLVMELLEGLSLAEWFDARPRLPSIEVVMGIMRQVFQALDAAHELGVIHRDLKPDNIMVRDRRAPEDQVPTIKLTDFGLAHVDHPGDDSPDTLTREHAIGGTPSYMSPEQCRSLRVDQRADLYSAGCVLTFLLQGKSVFSGRTPMDVIAKHMFAPTPPLERPAGAEPVPDWLENLRRKLLEKRPDDRIQTAKEALAILDAAGRGEVVGQRHESVPPRLGSFGTREDRVRVWEAGVTKQTPHFPTESLEFAGGIDELVVRVERQSEREDGLTDEILMALGAMGIAVRQTAGEQDEGPAKVALFDAGGEKAEAERWLKGHQSEEPAVLCIAGGVPVLTEMIGLGASEVVRYPVTAEKLAEAIRRAYRRSIRKR